MAKMTQSDVDKMNQLAGDVYRMVFEHLHVNTSPYISEVSASRIALACQLSFQREYQYNLFSLSGLTEY